MYYHFQALDQTTNTWCRVDIDDVDDLSGNEDLPWQGHGGDMPPWETWTLTECLEVRDHTIASWPNDGNRRGIRVVDDDGHILDYEGG